MADTYDAIVIGSGLGGSVCAALLAKQGMKILMLEKNKLVLARGYAKVRVLLADPGRAVYESSRFIGLARRITSYIEIRHAHPDFRSNRAAFLIADDRAVVYRSDASRWDGIVDLNDPAVARRYLDYFDQAWLGSSPHAETRQLHL